MSTRSPIHTPCFPAMVRLALAGYEGLWRGASPLLSRHHRLREGLPQRLGRRLPEGPFDIWIQAASAGEAYLAGLLIDRLGRESAHRILVTSNTRQGKDIVDAAIHTLDPEARPGRAVSAYFPFDRPTLMGNALATLRPRLVVLVETEIWPGLMSALKSRRIPILIVNGRLQARSLRHYRLWPRFWRALAPDGILAVSAEDAARYALLYGNGRVSTMPNMKFDRIGTHGDTGGFNPVRALMPPGVPLVVLGSVRREEEEAVLAMIGRLRERRPDLVIGLFPRHMHRLAAWRRQLETAGIAYRLRSATDTAASPGALLLWDVFGELARAYAVADAAFVGGSLAPLGGQNFLEPLSCGVVPTIGPSWDTFRWVGTDLFDRGLVRVAADGREAAEALIATLADPPPRPAVQAALAVYLAARRGGTAVAVTAIESCLKTASPAGSAPCAF